MKKIFSLLFSVLAIILFVSGCKKTSFVAKFDKSPEARMGDSMKAVKQTLVSAPYGWIVTTPVFFGGGYAFYMSFDDSMNVTMYSDLINSFSTTPLTSHTRIREDMGVALTFDTYNYISELNNPDNNVRDGYGGDVDYIYDHTNGDSIVFLGKRYRMPLAFVKATSTQKSLYASGDYLTAIQKFKDFFTTHSNAYITLDDGTKISIEPNSSNDLNAGKRITLTALSPQDSISSAAAKFAFTVDQMAILDSGVNIAGLQFTKIAWKDANTLAIYTTDGKEYAIQNSPAPILPLYMLMGVKYSGLYGDVVYPGASTSGASILNFYYNNLNSGAYLPYYFIWGYLEVDWDLANKRITLNGYSTQKAVGVRNSGWITSIKYTYTMDDNGQYTFTKFSAASGGYVAKIMTQFDSFLTSNTVKLGYYIDGNTAYGQMTSVEDPSISMTFQLEQ